MHLSPPQRLFCNSLCLRVELIPEPTVRSTVPGVSPGQRIHTANSARLFTPGKMQTQRSAKSINNRGRVTLVHGQCSWVDHLTDLKNMADCQEWKGQRFKKIYVRKITRHEEKFLQLSFKGMIRLDSRSVPCCNLH